MHLLNIFFIIMDYITKISMYNQYFRICCLQVSHSTLILVLYVSGGVLLNVQQGVPDTTMLSIHIIMFTMLYLCTYVYVSLLWNYSAETGNEFVNEYCNATHLIDILKVEPGVERSDGQVQVWQLEICYPRTDISLISINTKSSKSQAALIQTGQVQRDGEALIKNHGVCICLDLREAEDSRNVGF